MSSVTVVDTLEVSGEQIEQAIQLWDTFEAFISSQPGFISAKMLQAHEASSKFNIVILSEWESKESFDAGIRNPGHTKVGQSEVEYVRHRASYSTVREV